MTNPLERQMVPCPAFIPDDKGTCKNQHLNSMGCPVGDALKQECIKLGSTGELPEPAEQYIARLEWMVEWLAHNCDYRHGISEEDKADHRIKAAEQAWENEHGRCPE